MPSPRDTTAPCDLVWEPIANDRGRTRHPLVATWMEASRQGDLATVLSLMADDVVFMVPGQAPFGKEKFRAASEQMQGMHFEGQASIEDLQIFDRFAYVRNHIQVTATPQGGASQRRSGYTLSILCKDADGRWRLTRDANLVA